MYDELLSGYRTDQVELLNGAMYDVEYDEMVVVKDIDFYSLLDEMSVYYSLTTEELLTRGFRKAYRQAIEGV